MTPAAAGGAEIKERRGRRMEGCEATQSETGEAELRRGRFRVRTAKRRHQDKQINQREEWKRGVMGWEVWQWVEE